MVTHRLQDSSWCDRWTERWDGVGTADLLGTGRVALRPRARREVVRADKTTAAEPTGGGLQRPVGQNLQSLPRQNEFARRLLHLPTSTNRQDMQVAGRNQSSCHGAHAVAARVGSCPSRECVGTRHAASASTSGAGRVSSRVSHTLTSSSRLAVTTVAPPGPKTAEYTGPRCGNTPRTRPVTTSQIRAVPSSLAVTTSSPDGSNMAKLTAPWCSSRVWRGRPLSASQTRAILLAL